MRRWAVLVALACGCHGTGRRTEIHRGVEMLVRQGPSDAPLVVALHGRGGTPATFAAQWESFPIAAEVAFPRAEAHHGLGFQWIDWPAGLDEEEIGRRMIDAAERVWPAIVELAGARKVILVGFSQGAMIAFTLAARHPERVLHAFPIGGSCAKQVFLPGVTPAPVYAVHGSEDAAVPVKFDRYCVALMKEHGGKAELHEHGGVAHVLTREMREDVLGRLRPLLATR